MMMTKASTKSMTMMIFDIKKKERGLFLNIKILLKPFDDDSGCDINEEPIFNFIPGGSKKNKNKKKLSLSLSGRLKKI